MSYSPRIVDAELARRLTTAGAVVVEGPKACGKTVTATQVCRSTVLLDVDEEARFTAGTAPELVLRGETPRLIDEWQLEPGLWNHVRREVDRRKSPGQFVLTGSAVPADNIMRHTGAGRISRLRMRPLSLFEMGKSSGRLSLAELLDSSDGGSEAVPLSMETLASWVSEGGWPATLGWPEWSTREYVRDYLEEIRRADIHQVDGVERDPLRVARLIRSFARHVATHASIATLTKDAAGADQSLTAPTASAYLNSLERLMIVEDQPAWAPHLRSRSILRSAPKRHFVDPSLAVAAIGATPARLLKELKYLGFLFESLVVRDLRIYAQASSASVFQYHDNTGLEVDAIVERPDGRWGAFEVKLGARAIDEAADSLVRFAKRVDNEATGPPALLAVIVPGGYGYRREDGVHVVPLNCLGP
jgi:hypothetical protein